MSLAKGGAMKYTKEGINNVFFGKSSDSGKQSIYDTNKLLTKINADLAPWRAKKFFPISKGGESLSLESANQKVISGVMNQLNSVLTGIDLGSNNSASSASNPSSFDYQTVGSMPSSATTSYQDMADRNNLLSLAINRENNQFNADQAALQRSWATNLANTAHQREVADLKSAGLNPVLSAGGSGAVTPAGSTATNASYANVAGDSVIGALATLAASAMSANAVTTAAGINAQASMYGADQSAKANIFGAIQGAENVKYQSGHTMWGMIKDEIINRVDGKIDGFWSDVFKEINKHR